MQYINGSWQYVPDNVSQNGVSETTMTPNIGTDNGGLGSLIGSKMMTKRPSAFNEAIDLTPGSAIKTTTTDELSSTGESKSIIGNDNNNTSGSEPGMWDSFKNLFTPNGEKGTSTGGNILKGFGDFAGGIAGLGSLYYAGKNFQLQKDNYNYKKGLDNAAADKVAKLQSNYEKGSSPTATAANTVNTAGNGLGKLASIAGPAAVASTIKV